MSFQWLQMRIGEEKDRRAREAQILERLPRALEDLHRNLSTCLDSYTGEFGADAADLTLIGLKLRVVVRERQDDGWNETARVEIHAVPSVPGFQIDRGGESLLVEVGMLPGDKVFYRDREMDQYLIMEELTKRVLDRALFPKLRD